MAGIGVYATEIEKDSPLLAKRAKSRFESVLAQYNIKPSPMNKDSNTISAHWRDTDNRVGSLLGSDGRIFDLIVLGEDSDIGGLIGLPSANPLFLNVADRF